MRFMSNAGSGRQRLMACLQMVLGIILFFLIDSAAFRGGMYSRWVAPASGPGTMARAIGVIQSNPRGQASVVVIGDSRIGEGFSAKLATEEAERSGSNVTFTNAAVAGTDPRAWFYLLREAIAPGKSPTAIVIMVPSYHDNDREKQAERVVDIALLHPFLSINDFVDFTGSYLTARSRMDAASAILFRGMAYKNDIQDFLKDPAARISAVKSWRE